MVVSKSIFPDFIIHSIFFRPLVLVKVFEIRFEIETDGKAAIFLPSWLQVHFGADETVCQLLVIG